MLQAYSKGSLQVQNLSDASDTQILFQLLQTEGPIYDARDAGTTFRFLTSYLALSKRKAILGGSERMHQRPIAPLVIALRELGAEVSYLDKDGFPPLQFKGFRSQKTNKLAIDGSISSQFASSLLLASPTLPLGLSLEITGKASSLPYLLMTWELMQRAGVTGHYKDRIFEIPNQNFQSGKLEVQNDWSAASYWFGMAALSENEVNLEIPGIFIPSLQGDSQIVEISTLWGIETTVEKNGIRLRKGGGTKKSSKKLELDFSSIPDLAQTLVVLCCLSKLPFEFKGLESLAIKETNRLVALQKELSKIGISIQINDEMGSCRWEGKDQIKFEERLVFHTYEDHRMAMALSLISLKSPFPIIIENPKVVKKSYPGFWNALADLKFNFEENHL